MLAGEGKSLAAILLPANQPRSRGLLLAERLTDSRFSFPSKRELGRVRPRFLLTFGKPGQYSATLSEYPTDSHFQSFEFAEFHSLISVVRFNCGTN